MLGIRDRREEKCDVLKVPRSARGSRVHCSGRLDGKGAGQGGYTHLGIRVFVGEVELDGSGCLQGSATTRDGDAPDSVAEIQGTRLSIVRDLGDGAQHVTVAR
jgi:hypothetical protein